MPETALPTRDIKILLSDSGGQLAVGMTLIAVLSESDTDGDYAVHTYETSLTLTEDEMLLPLWPTSRGQKAAHYQLYIQHGGSTGPRHRFVKIQPADVDGQTLGELARAYVEAGAWTPQAKFPDGTEALPGLTLSSDPTTGFFADNAGDLAISRDGVSVGKAIGSLEVVALVTPYVTSAIEAQAASYVTLTGTQTLTNKTINLASNTLVATSAQLRAALTDETGTGAAVFAGSPALTGTPTAPTASQGTSTTQIATTEFVEAFGSTTRGIVSPLSFGAPSDGVSPASLGIQAAIDAVASRGATGVVWFDRPYAIDTSLVLPPGVILKGNASYNRRDFPNTFNGVRLYPHASAPDGISLLNVGGVGTMSSNPNGGYIDGMAFDGRLYNGDHKTGCVGMTIRDTSDFRTFNTYFGGFDRTNNTGICVLVEGTGEGNCFGTTFAQCIFSNSQHGVIYTGLGTTDPRHSNNLYVGVTRALSLGYDDRAPGAPVQLGGAGMQIVNDHFTYTGMPTSGWYIRNGGQGGSLMVANTYFDQHGTGTPIRLGGSKTKIIGSHFLCAKSQDSPGLIRVMSDGSQQTIVANCTVDLNECALQSLVYYSAKEGTPTGGVITGNMVYGTGASYLGAAIDSTGTLLPDAATASWVNNNNVRCT